MYKDGFRITKNTGNNSFSYDIRQEKNPDPKIYVTSLIQGTTDDIQLGDKIVFEEINAKGEIQSFVGLKNFVNIGPNIYIFDNHNHALFFRYQELFHGSITKGINLIHIDQHTDMNENSEHMIDNPGLKDIFEFVNYKCNVGGFIKPAIQDGLISGVMQINTEYKLLNSEFGILNSEFILDVDLDFRHPQMGIEQYAKTIGITKNLISQASLVTIATSPYFLDQTLAIKILKDIFST